MYGHYEINVSHKGRHMFATAPRSGRDRFDANLLLTEIIARFPESQGFEVTCTRYEVTGRRLTLDELQAGQ